MKITVMGCGRWGSFIAYYLDSIGHRVSLWGRESSPRMKQFASSRTNGMVTLPESIRLIYGAEEAAEAECIVVSVAAQSFREVAERIAGTGYGGDLVLCMKGIETSTGKLLSQVAREYLRDNGIAVWIGPGHVQEFIAGIPTCMVIDSDSEPLKEKLIKEFGSSLIRFYYGRDMIGNQLGAATKNVIGIAAGILDGLGMTNLKGALMSRGTREVSRLIAAMGGSEKSAYGLCHLGDYQATVVSRFSRNRAYGEALVSGKPFDKLAEGCYTAEAIMKLAEKYGVDMPICSAVYRVLYSNSDPREEIGLLFMRSLKREF